MSKSRTRVRFGHLPCSLRRYTQLGTDFLILCGQRVHVPAYRPEPWIMRYRLEAGSRIRSLREARNLSQEDLSELAGVDRKTVNRLETGARALTIDQAARLARALDGIPVDWFFRDDWELPGDGDPR